MLVILTRKDLQWDEFKKIKRKTTKLGQLGKKKVSRPLMKKLYEAIIETKHKTSLIKKYIYIITLVHG